MNENRYFIIFIVVVGLLLGTAAIISYIEDPGGAFTNGAYEKGIADIILSGHNVGNVGNFDDRIFQKDLIINDNRQIDVIVLGSSRSMHIQNSPLTGEKSGSLLFFNHYVSGASIEDYIAILELYFEKGYTPRTIIIGVDPWILNAYSGQNRWETLKDEYQNGVARIGSMPVRSEQDLIIHRYSSLISRPIVIESINRLLNNQNKTSYFQTDLEELDVRIILKDGSIVMPADARNRNVNKVDIDASEHANSDPLYSLGNFTQIDEKSKSQFESTIHYLKSRNVTIILWLAPYHPILYNKMSNDLQYSNVKKSELYFRTFASTENITIIGSYDPNVMNLTSGDFYDYMHPRRETIDKIFTSEVIGK